MAKARNPWNLTPAKKRAAVSASMKSEVEAKAKDLIENVLKPKHVLPPKSGEQFNYISDITTKWIGSTCYFISIYACPGPGAISPTFEEKFARIECVGDGKLTVSFMQHTGKWIELFTGISVDECMNAIKDDPWFAP